MLIKHQHINKQSSNTTNKSFKIQEKKQLLIIMKNPQLITYFQQFESQMNLVIISFNWFLIVMYINICTFRSHLSHPSLNISQTKDKISNWFYIKVSGGTVIMGVTHFYLSYNLQRQAEQKRPYTQQGDWLFK